MKCDFLKNGNNKTGDGFLNVGRNKDSLNVGKSDSPSIRENDSQSIVENDSPNIRKSESINMKREEFRNIGGEIDAHQHFWLYDRERFNWITDDMAVIRKNFLPGDLQPLLLQNGIRGCVAVQADQTEAETNFLLRLADENEIIRGIVGWVDLRAESVKERLAYYHQFPKIVGFRHVLQDEKPEFMLQPDFLRGIRTLKEFNFTYDLLVFPQHLEAALKLVKLFPDQPFVIDHIAKPAIRTGLIKDWKKGIRNIARCPNVYCKISGMVTEADFKRWTQTDFTPYLDVVIDAFGIDRIMYGSDWPVCQVAAAYEQVFGIVKTYFSSFSPSEQALFFGGNVSRFYRLA